MKDESLKEFLEDLINCHKGEYNRHLIGMTSLEEYEDRKDGMIEDTINQIGNLSIMDEINNLKRGLK